MNDVRTNLADSQLPRSYWIDAATYAVYTRNRITDKTGTSPLQRFQPDTPQSQTDYTRLHAFGAPCVYRVVNPASKIDVRGEKAVLIGYGMGTTSYTLLTEGKRVIVSRDVVFTNKVLPNHLDKSQVKGQEEIELDEEPCDNGANQQINNIDEDAIEFEDLSEQPEGPHRQVNAGLGWHYEAV